MKIRGILLALTLLARVAPAQQRVAAVDSVFITTHFGSDNKELDQLMSRVLRIEKHHFEVHNPTLAGKVFHLTFQEYRNGVPGPEKELTDNPKGLTSFDKAGNFTFDVFARQAGDASLENTFMFAQGMNVKSFKLVADRADQYSMRPDIWSYRRIKNPAAASGARPSEGRNFPVGQKIPFLVYTLPYEEDGFLYYCSVAHSKIPITSWYAKFKVPHFVVYNLIIE